MSAAWAAMSVATSSSPRPCAPPISGTQVAELELHPVDGVAPPGPVPSLPSGRGRPGAEVRGVAGHESVRARRPPPVGPRRTAGSSRRGGSASSWRSGRRRRATCGRASRGAAERRSRRRPSTTAQMLDRSKPPANTDAVRSSVPFVVGQQVVGPLDGVAKRELTLWTRCAAPQQTEPVGEPVPDLDRAHRRHPGRREFDAERQPVDGLADLRHRCRGCGVRELEVVAGPRGPARRTA